MRFGDLVLDLASQRLLHEGTEVPLRAKTFSVLAHLATNADRLITKNELFDAVWPGTSVTDTVLAASISELRKALGEDLREPRFIQTVHRKGYRFLAGPATDASAPGSPMARPSQATVRLYGRDEEIRRLHQELAQAAAGSPRLVFVTAEAGGGKTTLVHGFVDSLPTAAAPPIVAIGQCLPEYDVGEPFLPVIDALGHLLRSPDGGRLRDALHRSSPDWLALLGEGTRTASVSLDRLLYEIARVLDEFAAQATLVLVLEDLHWSDPSTLALLQALALRASRARLLVVGTYRPVEAILGNRDVGAVRRDVVLKQRGCELALRGLSAGAVAEFYAERYGDPGLAAQLAGRLAAHTEGFPLFLVALADHLEESGALVRQDGRWILRGSLERIEATIPQTVREMIERRMESLAPDERAVLEAGAVVGDAFSVAMAADVLGRPLGEIDERCLALSRTRGLLAIDGETRWPDGTPSTRFRFAHAWYPRVLYDALSATRRRELHAAVAARLEAAHASKPRLVAAELAVHFERADECRRAAEYRLLAGRTLLRRSPSEEAIGQLQKGLEVLARGGGSGEPTDLEVDLRAHLSLALLQNRGYTHPDVGEAYESLLALCRPRGDGVRHIQALTGLATFRFSRAELAAGLVLMNEGIEMGRRLGIPPLLYSGLVLFTAETRFYQGEIARAEAVVAEATRLIDSEGLAHQPTEGVYLVSPAVYARTMSGMMLEVLGRHDEAVAACADAIAEAGKRSHTYSLVSALSFNSLRRVLSREWEALAADAPRAIALADEQVFAHWGWVMRLLHGRALASLPGRADEGLALAHEAMERRRAVGAGFGQALSHMLIAQAYADAGRWDHALTWSERALEAGRKSEERWTDAEVQITHGEILLGADAANVHVARGLFEAAREIAARQGALLFVRRAEDAIRRLSDGEPA